MSHASRPPFIDRGGSMLLHPPFQQQNSLLFGFFLKADRARLQRLCDRQLNAVARGQYRFEPLSNYVMLTFTRINKDYSLHPEDRAKGWGAEIDTSIWVPVGQYVIKDGQKVLDRIHWTMPYIWVDHPMTILNGRELFGYPKYLGRFEMPTRPEDADWFSLDTNAFLTYTPETEAAWHRVLDVRRGSAPGSTPLTQWASYADLAKGLFGVLRQLDDAVFAETALSAQLLEGLLSPRLPQLFLKQFPDGRGERAVYQALVTSPAVINGFRGAGPLLGDYTCTLQAFASEPIAEDLGLVIGPQPVALGFWVDFDFAIEPVEELVNNSVVAPQKVAVLGGGVSALTAVYGLTAQPDWQSRYDITVYQMGWRLGGKGASGRNADHGQRIEEHGLHIWFGFYENAFKVMQDCYAEWQQAPGAPLRRWDDAFKPQSFVVLMEYLQEHWQIWPFEFPEKPGRPGDGEESPSLWNVVQTMFAWLRQLSEQLIEASTGLDVYRPVPAARDGLAGAIDWLLDRVQAPLEAASHEAVKLLALFARFTDLDDKLLRSDDADHAIAALVQLKNWLLEFVDDRIEAHTEIRRLFILLDLGLTTLKGMFVDDVFTRGFAAINDIDFRDWLRRHGAHEELTVQSAPVRGLYDLVFAYEDGDIARPNIEAGTCLSGALRIVFCYKGGIMWKMQAGMGDVVFSPLYEVLRARGVKFQFFHQLDALVPEANAADQIGEIRLTRQVQLNGPEYRPLVDVKGVASWPSTPLWEQLDAEQATLLQANAINLESSWSPWPEIYRRHFGAPLPTVSLKRGEDFDLVIYGLSVGALPHTCAELLPHSPALRAAATHVKAVVTQAYQLWLSADLPELGWQLKSPTGEEPVLTSFTEPLDTWAAMGQLLCREDWPAGGAPKALAYFCGVQAISQFPPFSEHDFPARCRDAVKAAVLTQLNDDIRGLWPDAATPDGFRWELLHAPAGTEGAARLSAQYWRSNIDPSERYVQSVAGSSRYRPATDGTGYQNLYVTGDWIRTGINAGCVEAAVQAGLQTSRAISGWPEVVKGEKDFT